jgi:hypothetical protein
VTREKFGIDSKITLRGPKSHATSNLILKNNPKCHKQCKTDSNATQKIQKAHKKCRK